MSFDPEDFVRIAKNSKMPAKPQATRDSFLLNEKSCAIGEDVFKQFASGDHRAYMVLHYSEKEKAFLIEKSEPGIGYAFRRYKSFGPALLTTIPAGLRKLQPVRGIYERSIEYPNIFVLQDKNSPRTEEPTKPLTFLDNPEDIKVGSIVCWPQCQRQRKEAQRLFINTGRVLEIKDGRATIKPMNKRFIDKAPNMTVVHVQLSMLILRSI